jgi:hypothetical protein
MPSRIDHIVLHGIGPMAFDGPLHPGRRKQARAERSQKRRPQSTPQRWPGPLRRRRGSTSGIANPRPHKMAVFLNHRPGGRKFPGGCRANIGQHQIPADAVIKPSREDPSEVVDARFLSTSTARNRARIQRARLPCQSAVQRPKLDTRGGLGHPRGVVSVVSPQCHLGRRVQVHRRVPPPWPSRGGKHSVA